MFKLHVWNSECVSPKNIFRCQFSKTFQWALTYNLSKTKGSRMAWGIHLSDYFIGNMRQTSWSWEWSGLIPDAPSSEELVGRSGRACTWGGGRPEPCFPEGTLSTLFLQEHILLTTSCGPPVPGGIGPLWPRYRAPPARAVTSSESPADIVFTLRFHCFTLRGPCF